MQPRSRRRNYQLGAMHHIRAVRRRRICRVWPTAAQRTLRHRCRSSQPPPSVGSPCRRALLHPPCRCSRHCTICPHSYQWVPRSHCCACGSGRRKKVTACVRLFPSRTRHRWLVGCARKVAALRPQIDGGLINLHT